MKNIKSILTTLCLALLLASGFISCVGDSQDQLAIIAPAQGARVKFHHMISDGPGISILVNNRQFSGVLTVAPATPGLVTYGNFFPAVDYATVEAGSAKVDVIIPASGTTPQGSLFSGTVPLEANKYYSVFAVGSAATPTTLETIVVEDKLVPADTSKAYVRFINTAVNATTGYDMGIGTTYLATNVKYKQVTDFTAITPVPTGGTPLQLLIRVNGTTTNLAPTALTLSPIRGRFYTVFIRGRVGGTGTQALAGGFLTNR